MILPSSVQVVLFPPIGGDARVFYPQKTLPFDVITPSPLRFESGDSLYSAARRYHAELMASGIVDPTRPVIWGGLSLGGAIAQEVARLHPPLGLILLGSFRSANELHPVVKVVGTAAHRIPLWGLKLAERLAPVVMRLLSYMPSQDVDLCARMYREHDKNSFRHCFRALSLWKGCKVSAPLLRIHGRSDPIIPIVRAKDMTHPLDTMHIVTLGDRQNVNRIIAEFVMRRCETSRWP